MIITLKSQVPFKCQLKQINNKKKKTNHQTNVTTDITQAVQYSTT